jgi:hypothetical protein
MEVGKLLLRGKVEQLVEMVRAVKLDKTVLRLQDEFFRRADRPLAGK